MSHELDIHEVPNPVDAAPEAVDAVLERDAVDADLELETSHRSPPVLRPREQRVVVVASALTQQVLEHSREVDRSKQSDLEPVLGILGPEPGLYFLRLLSSHRDHRSKLLDVDRDAACEHVVEHQYRLFDPVFDRKRHREYWLSV